MTREKISSVMGLAFLSVVGGIAGKAAFELPVDVYNLSVEDQDNVNKDYERTLGLLGAMLGAGLFAATAVSRTSKKTEPQPQ